jgi:hypothetical protein
MLSKRLTVEIALREIIGLSVLNVVTNKLEIDFILDIGHHNEGTDDTLATAGRHGGRNTSVPDVPRAGHESTRRVRSHRQQESLIVVDDGASLNLPIGLVRIAQVVVDSLDAVQRVESELAILTGRSSHTGVDRMRVSNVAAAETVGADTTLTVLYTNVSFGRDTRQKAMSPYGNSRAHIPGMVYPGRRKGSRPKRWTPAMKRRPRSKQRKGP